MINTPKRVIDVEVVHAKYWKVNRPFKNQLVGMKSADGKRYWRIDWDANKGAHINWVNGKAKGAIPFTGDLEQAKRIVNNVIGN